MANASNALFRRPSVRRFPFLSSAYCVRLSSSRVASGDALRSALRTLSLPDDASDAEIKLRFQQFAKTNHPDVTPSSASAAPDTMRHALEAYKLLRQHSAAERRRVLSNVSTETNHPRAQRVYAGQKRRRPNAKNESASQTAAFNTRRGGAMRWQFFGSNGWTQRAAMERVFEEYQRNSGFAGLDGSRYDDPKNTSRATSAAPNGADSAAQQFVWMRQRAKERAIVDAAVGQPMVLGILLLLVLSVLSMGYVVIVRRALAKRNYSALNPIHGEDDK